MDRTGEAVTDNRDILLGVKIQVRFQHERPLQPRFSEDRRASLCDKFKLPLMAHISFAPPETPEVMELMRPGDIITHCLQRPHARDHQSGRQAEAGCGRGRGRGVLVRSRSRARQLQLRRRAEVPGCGLPVRHHFHRYLQPEREKGPVLRHDHTMSKLLHIGMTFQMLWARTHSHAGADRQPAAGDGDAHGWRPGGRGAAATRGRANSGWSIHSGTTEGRSAASSAKLDDLRRDAR